MKLAMIWTIVFVRQVTSYPNRNHAVPGQNNAPPLPPRESETTRTDSVLSRGQRYPAKGSLAAYRPLQHSISSALLLALRGGPVLAQGTSLGAAPELSPGAEPESKASSEPESKATTAKTEPESEATAEGNVTSQSSAEPEPEAESWPEPGPRWSLAFKQWKSAWGIHVYFFGVSFLLMGLYSSYFVIFNVYDGLNKKYLSVSLNIMVLAFGFTRALVLFLDPYHQGGVVKAASIMRLLWSLGGPCLTAADSLIILALLEMSRVTITTPKLQQPGIIVVIIAFHFLFVITTDFVVANFVSAKGMILFCQIFFVVWGAVLGTGYFRLGYILDKKLFGHKVVKEKADKLYVMLIYASGAANYVLCIIMIYTGAGVFGVYSDVTFVDAWSWWILQTLFRLSEVVTCVLIFTVSAKRTRVKRAMDDVTSASQGSKTDLSLKVQSLQKLGSAFIAKFNSSKVQDVIIIPDNNEGMDNPVKPVPSRRMSMFTAMQNESLATMPTAPARVRTRRQSMFSAMNDAAIQSNDACAPVRRTRRQSLFSAMEDASVAATSPGAHDEISGYSPAQINNAGSEMIETDLYIETLDSEKDKPNEDTKWGCKARNLRKPIYKRSFAFTSNQIADLTSSAYVLEWNGMAEIEEESEYEEEVDMGRVSVVERFGGAGRLLRRLSSLKSLKSSFEESPEETSKAHENSGFEPDNSNTGLSEIVE